MCPCQESNLGRSRTGGVLDHRAAGALRVEPVGIEPTTSWVQTRRSPFVELRPRVRAQGVEPRPPACRAGARPLELHAHVPTPGIEPGCSALQAAAWTTTARSANTTAVRTGIEPVSMA